MFALAPWERPLTYGDAAASEALRKEEVLVSFFARAQALLKKFGGGGGAPRLPTRWEVGRGSPVGHFPLLPPLHAGMLHAAAVACS